MSNYFEQQLAGLMTVGKDDAVMVKFHTFHTDTKWMSLRPSEFEAVEALLVELYASREQAAAPAQPLESRARQQPTPAQRLEYLRSQIEAENISYGEIAELQSLASHIQSGDTQLLEWAGVPEHEEQES